MSDGDILNVHDAEQFVSALKAFDLKHIGRNTWLKQHEYLEKLNVQSHVNAAMQKDDFVKDVLLSYEKVNLLVYELVLMEVWRENVKPRLEKLGYAKNNSLLPYMVQFHEATVANLLESILFFGEVCDAISDNVVDVIDYCHRCIQFLNSRDEDIIEEEDKLNKIEPKELNKLSPQKQLDYQTRNLRFQICIRAVAILRYLTDNITSLPLGAMTRMLSTLDLPSALVTLVISPPWTRQRDGKLQKLDEMNEWVDVPPSDRFKLTKNEGQVWLALYNLLMEPECRKKYSFSTYNKNHILKLRAYLNDVVIAQVPVLGELRRYLEELSLTDPPPPNTGVVVEQIAELRHHLMHAHTTGSGSWDKVAKYQLKTVFTADEATKMKQAKALASTYNYDTLECMFPNAPKCAVCGHEATKRCSYCKSEWYCRRQCQVEHWPKHKAVCAVLRKERGDGE
eukprot:m.63502 g.63502  ORF g.63502 m.63502 type:complete len:452 (+) comp11443_c0_seq2:572-1927(+)